MPDQIDVPREWDAEWQKLDVTINEDVWLLTERIKLNYLGPMLARIKNSLEVGCGSAKFSVFLARQGISITGIDLSPNALKVAKNNSRYFNVTGDFLLANGLKLPFPDNRFDLVFSTGLLEHFYDPAPLVEEMARVLRPGGIFFSDIVPLKFSLVRLAWYMQGKHKDVADEHPYNKRDIHRWLETAHLQNIHVFSSCVAPPLGFMRRVPGLRELATRYNWPWVIFDGTPISDWLGFFFLAFANKAR